MDIQIRPALPAEYPEIALVDGISFGVVYSEQQLGDAFAAPPELLVATEADRIVGAAGHYRFGMRLPGGGSLDVPGVTWVSVLPTHRRRGVLTALMERQLADYAEAGEPASILTASQGGIYSRFGYGPATKGVKTVVDRRSARMAHPVDASAAEFVSVETARTLLPELHRRWQASTPAALSRDEALWQQWFLDREADRGGLSQRFYLVHPDGYLSYRVSENWSDPDPAHRCVIDDYIAVTEQAHAALWQVLLGMDLFGVIESWRVPLDDPLPFLLTDPRQFQIVAVQDGLWLRPLDVAKLLAARRYAVDVEAVLEVAGQRLRLVGSPEHATCEPVEVTAEVTFSLSALGSVYLGGHRVRTLARAGSVQVHRRALLDRLDLAFGSSQLPTHGTGF